MSIGTCAQRQATIEGLDDRKSYSNEISALSLGRTRNFPMPPEALAEMTAIDNKFVLHAPFRHATRLSSSMTSKVAALKRQRWGTGYAAF